MGGFSLLGLLAWFIEFIVGLFTDQEEEFAEKYPELAKMGVTEPQFTAYNAYWVIMHWYFLYNGVGTPPRVNWIFRMAVDAYKKKDRKVSSENDAMLGDGVNNFFSWLTSGKDNADKVLAGSETRSQEEKDELKSNVKALGDDADFITSMVSRDEGKGVKLLGVKPLANTPGIEYLNPRSPESIEQVKEMLAKSKHYGQVGPYAGQLYQIGATLLGKGMPYKDLGGNSQVDVKQIYYQISERALTCNLRDLSSWDVGADFTTEQKKNIIANFLKRYDALTAYLKKIDIKMFASAGK